MVRNKIAIIIVMQKSTFGVFATAWRMYSAQEKGCGA